MLYQPCSRSTNSPYFIRHIQHCIFNGNLFTNSSEILNDLLELISEQGNNLLFLRVENVKLTIPQLRIISNLDQLKGLELFNCSLSRFKLKCLCTGTLDLHYLGIAYNPNVSDIYALIKFTKFKKLDLRGTSVTNDQLLFLHNFQDLETLLLSNNPKITNIDCLLVIKSLKVIEVFNTDVSFVDETWFTASNTLILNNSYHGFIRNQNCQTLNKCYNFQFTLHPNKDSGFNLFHINNNEAT